MHSSASEIKGNASTIPSEVMIEHFALFCGNSIIIDLFQIFFFIIIKNIYAMRTCVLINFVYYFLVYFV
jgi:hypothetical protein